VVEGDLADRAGLISLCGGIDTVGHLAANPRADAPWKSLLPDNVVGTYQMLEPPRRQNRMDLSETRELLGYQPSDDFARESPRLQEAGLPLRHAHSEADK
jgi:NAD+ dependent glucose-6-phosphate dehydrogenase